MIGCQFDDNYMPVAPLNGTIQRTILLIVQYRADEDKTESI